MNRQATASLTLGLARNSDEPAYRQIARQIREMIETHRLAPQAKLPSSRQLARDLGVSRITTNNSYETLVAEGYLMSLPRKGHFVAERLPRLNAGTERPVRAGAAPKPARTVEAPLRFDSGASVLDFPNARWRRCLRDGWLSPDPDLMEDTVSGGDPGLKQAIVDHLFHLRGLRCRPEQILITAGNRDALTIILNTLRQRVDASHEVGLENPGYPPIANNVRSQGLTPVPLAVDSEGAVPPEPGPVRAPMAAILTPARQYPLGMTMSPQRRQDWLAFGAAQAASGREFWLIEDDYDSEFVYQGRPQAPLMMADEAHRTLLVGSFSKSLFRALRIGYVVAPPSIVDALLATQRHLGSSVALPLQPALARFLAGDHFASHLRRMRRLYLHRRDHLLARLKAFEPGLIPWPCPGGMHILAELAAGHSEPALVARARESGLELDPLSRHYWAPAAPGNPRQGLLLGFTARDDKHHEAALDRLHRALQETTEQPRR